MTSFAANVAIVLVHGAWADGSCWQSVILPLRNEGLQVTCAPILLTSLKEDIAALERVLERTNGPVILAGHAYGGAVITEAPARCARVYLEAGRGLCPRSRSQGFTEADSDSPSSAAADCGEMHSRESSSTGVENTERSWFLLAEEDRMVAQDRQRFTAHRMGAKIRIHRVDHSPMYTPPDVVVGVILGAVQWTLA